MIWRFAILVALSILTVEAKKYSQKWEEQEQWQEFEEFLKWKKMRELREYQPQEMKYEKQRYEIRDMEKISERDQQPPVVPPPVDRAALMARFIVNQADWVSVATISTRKDIESYPTVNLISYSDGLLGNGSGVPYLYLTPLDYTAQDLARDNRVTLLMTLAQGEYCKSKQWDPMDPRCARVLLSGKMKPLKNESAELDLAKKVFFDRHPKLANMPPDHHFYFAKLKISTIAVLDTFGGPKYVTVRDYLHPPVDNVTAEFIRLFPVEFDENDSRQKYAPVSNMLNPVVRTV
ncbi:protein CREG1 [Hylaeus anthracinus]|uniref:protein CREG1 n=1 Tax=Hylaeus anthracinus TaxID=313031 RepID=UPI0023BA03A0|nr:protein CREG1 [Hylaeus anthracinus]